MKRFGPSWIQSVKSSGITYWFICALDPWTSMALGSLDVGDHCFNAPVDELGYKGEGEGCCSRVRIIRLPGTCSVWHSAAGTSYQWGSLHWHQTTWNKVYVMRAIYAMGFDVLHSDADSTWWNDPLPWFKQVRPLLAALQNRPCLRSHTCELRYKGPCLRSHTCGLARSSQRTLMSPLMRSSALIP
jgi:hypothetical protein